MAYLGSWKINDHLTFYCNTHAVTGVATDADAVPTYRIYEDETAPPIVTGSMAKLDDANTTGFYSEHIQLTAASGFEKGKQYTIYKEATVAGDTGTIHDTFQIEAEVDANTVGDKTGYGLANDAITSDKLAATALNAIADEVLKRAVSNVEDTADEASLAALILAAFEWSLSGTTWTIRKTGGETFKQRTVTLTEGADPVTGVT